MKPSDSHQPKRRRSVRRKDERELRNQISRYNRLFHIGQLLTSEMFKGDVLYLLTSFNFSFNRI